MVSVMFVEQHAVQDLNFAPYLNFALIPSDNLFVNF
jgi:hypothetical protein